MTTLRSSSFLRLFVLPFLLSFWVSACTTTKVLDPPLERSLAAEQPKSVTVTLNDGQRFKIFSPSISNDSIVGVRGYRLDPGQAKVQRIAVALDDVAHVEHSEFSAGKTVGRTVFVILGIFAVAFIADCLDNDEGLYDLC